MHVTNSTSVQSTYKNAIHLSAQWLEHIFPLFVLCPRKKVKAKATSFISNVKDYSILMWCNANGTIGHINVIVCLDSDSNLVAEKSVKCYRNIVSATVRSQKHCAFGHLKSYKMHEFAYN